jgi:hypothetical protein
MEVTERGNDMRKLLRLINDSTAQALPLALVALALGSLLVSPFLLNASVNLLASRQIDSSIRDYYSADAGVEWALWRLKNDPTLTTSTSYVEAPLQPTPAAVNGFSFPKTEIRRVTAAGTSESITPVWQEGVGPKCYPFTSSEVGTIFAAVAHPTATQVWITLLSDSDPCVKPVGLNPVEGPPPYTVQFSDRVAGSYQLLVETSPSGTGTVTISYPVASYDIRSEMNGRSVTSRATASANAVRIVSWQLE